MNDLTRGRHTVRHRSWPLVLGGVLLLPIVLWIVRVPVLREAAALWVVSDPIKPADAIAVLGGGLDLRPFTAAQLFREGLAPKVLVANVKPDALVRLGLLGSHADLTRALLLKLGVPPGAVIGFGDNVSSTFDEARALAAWAKKSGARNIIVPTEIFSSRRQRWILDHELTPVGTHVMLDAIKPPDYGIDDWWRHK
ncbi:MAG: YdcF family protein, partial [Xanthobacteraceae bacterium]